MKQHTLYSGLPSEPCEEALKWKHPYTFIVGGPSGSGMMSFIVQLRKDDDVMFTEIPLDEFRTSGFFKTVGFIIVQNWSPANVPVIVWCVETMRERVFHHVR